MDYDYISYIDIAYDYLYLSYRCLLLCSSRLYLSITTVYSLLYMGLFVLEGGYGVKWGQARGAGDPGPGFDYRNTLQIIDLFVKFVFCE